MYRRRRRHNLDSVTIGRYAGEESYTENTVSVGRKAGYSQQKQWAIAIGDRAGEETQDLNAIAIGILAGQNSQSTLAIAIGNQAGRTAQGAKAMAIGGNAGQSTQSTLAIAIGENAGQTAQGAGAIAIGENAGQSSQGANSIAIGNRAGVSGQLESSIVISTSQTEITAAKKGLYIDPIRNFDDRDSVPLNGNILTHLHETKEVVTGLPKLPGYTTDPTSSDAGTLYFNTDKNKVKVYNGTKWVALSDEDDLKKLKEELMVAIKSATKSVSNAASAALGGGSGAVVGADSGNTQFVTGGGTTVGGASGVQYFNPDGTPAQSGYDFYWEPNGAGDSGYHPIFYRDLEVVSEKVPEHVNGSPNAPGNYVTTYSNGHQSIEPIPTAVWNPPLDAFNNLPDNERRELITGYGEQTGATFLTWPVSDNELNSHESFGGSPFRSYLESQGVTGTTP